MELDSTTPTRKVSIFAQRASKHINNFISVNIHFRDGSEFPLTLDINNTLEYVARQIEAEAVIRNLEFTEGDTRVDHISKAIDVYQLYDAANLAIPFSAKVKDVLLFDDYIFPITSKDDSLLQEILQETGIPFFKPQGSSPHISINNSHDSIYAALVSPLTGETEFGTVEDRLNSVLHNISALYFFNEFCLKEYTIENILFWIEAEVFRSITDIVYRKIFAKHLVDTYVKLDAPLSLNVDGEIRQTVLSQYQEANSAMFEELQSFIYILIKQAAYIRFEDSPIFQNFLKSKQEDQYSYDQGKTDWNFALLNKNHILERAVVEEGYSSVNMGTLVSREKVLSDVLARYFPNSAKVAKKYFDMGERKEIGARTRNLHKQKKLTKFFGGQPGAEYMRHQINDTKSVDTYSISSGTESSGIANDFSEDANQKRKKAEKLSGFFGNYLTDRQIKKHGVQDESSGVPQSADDDIVGTVNLLSPEEKLMLQKKARKLLFLLGTGVDGSHIVSLNNSQKQNPENEESYIEQRISVSSLEDSPSASTSKLIQKSRLDKLSHVMGERISEDHLKDHNIDEYLPRPLTPIEKKVLLKKNNKLERVFGNTVPAGDVINFESLSLLHLDHDSIVSPCQQTGSAISGKFGGEEDRKNALLRLRKLKKMLGLNDGSVPLTVEAMQQIQDAINIIVEDESAKTSMLEELQDLSPLAISAAKECAISQSPKGSVSVVSNSSSTPKGSYSPDKRISLGSETPDRNSKTSQGYPQ